MTHFDLSKVKTEPLSPSSVDELWQNITRSPPMSHSPAASSMNQPTTPSPYSTGSTNTANRCGPRAGDLAIKGNGSGGVSQSPVQTVPPSDMRNALKSTILERRRARGEMSLPPLENKPRDCKLSKKEIIKKEARKEQNRRAAKKCRLKKKLQETEASEEMTQARKENCQMQNEVRNLRQQVSQLQKIILDHEETQNCKLSPLHPSSISKTDTNVRQTKFYTDKLSPCLLSPEVPAVVNTVSPTSLPPVHFHQSSMLCPSTDIPTQTFVENCPDVLSSTCSETELPGYFHLGSYDSNNNNNTMQNEPSTPSFPSWDLNNLISDLPADQEVSANLSNIIDNLVENDMEIEYETPKVDGGDIKPIHKPVFSCISNEETPKTRILSKNTNFKPPFVRNLNRFFMQSDYLSNDDQKQQQDTMARLLDSRLSSSILTCVPPNLVQQPPVPASNTSSDGSSPSHVCNTTVTHTPFEHQVIAQVTDNQFPSEPNDLHDFARINESDLPVLNDLHDLQLLSADNFEDNQSNTMSFQHFLCQPHSFPVLPPDVTITECHGSNTSSDVTDAPRTSSSTGFTYQYSPVSDSSPSYASSISSPDFLQPSPHDVGSNNNSATFFDFNF